MNSLLRVSIAYCFVLLLTATLFLGCSSNIFNPAEPSHKTLEDNLSAARDNNGQRFIWGYFTGYADSETGEFELTPLRTANTHFNLVSTLNTAGGVSAQVIWQDSTPADGEFSVRVTLTNPYSAMPKYVGFDVRGIFISGASKHVGAGLWTAMDGKPRLLNADGWTRWWNPSEFSSPGLFGYTDGILGNADTGDFDAQLNGYKIFADALPDEQEMDLEYLTIPELNDDNGRAVFRSACLSRRYEIKFPPGISKFNYAIDASWAPPLVNPPEVPDSFPPNANCPEACWIHPDITTNTLEYKSTTGEHFGSLSINVTVYDWQGGIYGSLPAQVDSVKIHSFDLFGDDSVEASYVYDEGLFGIYSADLTSLCDPQYVGTYWLLVEVVSYYGSYKQSWQDAPDAPLAAYMLIPVEVEEYSETPPELVKKFGIHAYVLRKSDGSDPAASDAEIEEDITWANEFWNQYGFGFELTERTYIDASDYYNCPKSQCEEVWEMAHDCTGLVNVYYMNDIIGSPNTFAWLNCFTSVQNGVNSGIFFSSSDYSDWNEVIAHELGHAVGMLHDEYLLDYYPTCHDLIVAWCGFFTEALYCLEEDAVSGNLMWYLLPFPGDPDDYFFSSEDMEMNTPQIDSQAEHVAYFNINNPENFKDMQ